MIEPIVDMPDGVLGFRATGPLTREDYTEVLLPPLHAAVENGRGVRMVFVATSEMNKIEPMALWEDLKAEIGLGLRHASAWERVALATDHGWIRKAMGMFGWLAPGEVKVFDEADVTVATTWAAG